MMVHLHGHQSKCTCMRWLVHGVLDDTGLGSGGEAKSQNPQ